MLQLFAFIAFLIAVILEATEESPWLISSLGWVAIGLALMALGGAWGWVGPRINR